MFLLGWWRNVGGSENDFSLVLLVVVECCCWWSENVFVGGAVGVVGVNRMLSGLVFIFFSINRIITI